MATLTEVGHYSRNIIKWGIIGLVIILITPPILKGIRQAYLTLRPPPPPPPTIKYGKLPKLAFPLPSEPYKPLFKLETIDGKLPTFSSVGKVYFVEINKSRLLEFERIKARAKILGFLEEPVRVDDQTLKFTSSSIAADMTVNLISGSFNYYYDWTGDESLLKPGSLPTKEQAILEAKALLQNMNLLSKDLADGEAKVTFLKTAGASLVPALAFSESKFIRVDLYRAPKDDLKISTIKGEESPIYVIFSGSTDRDKRIIAARYSYSKTQDSEFGTYYLKSSEQAWTELQQGGGFIVKKAGNTAVIRKIYMAYFESDTTQEYLQPIIVFEGDGGFLAYISAIDPTQN